MPLPRPVDGYRRASDQPPWAPLERGSRRRSSCRAAAADDATPGAKGPVARPTRAIAAARDGPTNPAGAARRARTRLRRGAGWVIVANVSDRPKSSRAGGLGLLLIAGAAVAAYLGNCLGSLGLPGPGATPPAPATATDKPATDKPATGKAGPAEARVRIVVEGEQCRSDGEPTPRDCKTVCELATGKTAELDATAGAQGTVDALRTCLQDRGLKVSVLSE